MTLTPETIQNKVRWAAGYIDGDGSIFCRTGSLPEGDMLMLSASSTKQTGLEVLADLFGGRVCPDPKTNPNCAPAFRWRVSGKRALAAIQRLYPFLVLRKRQGAIALNYPVWQGGIKTPRLVHILREEVSKALRILNRRGPC